MCVQEVCSEALTCDRRRALPERGRCSRTPVPVVSVWHAMVCHVRVRESLAETAGNGPALAGGAMGEAG